MALTSYQTTITKQTLYEIFALGGVSGIGAQLAPTIEIIGGSGDVYVSQTEPGSAPTGMAIIENGSDLTGTAAFSYLPRYLYVDENTATITSIVLTGISATAVA